MRVAVLDIGSNTTRLLIAELGAGGSVTELDRRTTVTRLGEGVDKNRKLGDAAIGRVRKALDEYAQLMQGAGVEANIAVLTSAVRDSENGERFMATLRDGYGLDARILSGEEEAQMTFSGAMSGRSADDKRRTLVIDLGGGSTELIIGVPGRVDFHVSLQLGVVRQTERHVREDPPSESDLRALKRDVRTLIERDVPVSERRDVERAIAVAGTATSLAAIDQALEPYARDRVHGHAIELSTARLLLARLASVPLAERRRIRGLHPDRAPTIVAGTAILIEVLESFGLEAFEASENDILLGAAISLAR
jgi:exopolyphosphatase/guanosine-5'-triphosphate,3'-diphosphate pyrophosphatase